MKALFGQSSGVCTCVNDDAARKGWSVLPGKWSFQLCEVLLCAQPGSEALAGRTWGWTAGQIPTLG